MQSKSFSVLLLIVLTLFVIGSSLFVVDARERALVLRFGEVQRDDKGAPLVYMPGLHVKMPLADTIKRLDARIQNLDGDADRVQTLEKKDVIVDSFVKWKVKDFSHFYLSTNGDVRKASELLERKVDSAVREEFGKRIIRDLVSEARLEAMFNLRDSIHADAEDLGIEIVDIRIKQINLPNEVSESVYANMRAERVKTATELRSTGQGEANIIKAKTDAEVKILLAQSDQESRRIRGEGDATAAKIYADTYKQNPEFYAFLRSLDAYRASFTSEKDVMVLAPDSDFFKYMRSKTGK
mgnify:CR=1 FL=1